MPILNIVTSQTGTTGVTPSLAYIATTDTISQVTTAGYLTQAVDSNLASFSFPCLAIISTVSAPGAQPLANTYQITSVNGVVSATATAGSGGATVSLPTIANHIGVYTNTSGNLSEDAATAINAGNIQAGISGTAGYLASFPATASTGSLEVQATANSGNTVTVITNASMGQATTVMIPDPGTDLTEFIVADSTSIQYINSGAFGVLNGAVESGSGTGGGIGSFIAFPSPAASGAIIMQGSPNIIGDFAVTLTNDTTQTQNTLLTVSDVGSTTGAIVTSQNPLVIGSTELGVVGGSPTFVVNNTTVTVDSVVIGNFLSQANPSSVLTVSPGAGSFTVTTSADPGTSVFGYAVFNS